ncbi:MAG: AbrB/MazE/SpoVT family DNA-binding domain-containing protein [Opitutales bacterium]
MESSVVTSKGQTTLPKRVRQRLNLKQGDRLYFQESQKGEIILGAKTMFIAEFSPLKLSAIAVPLENVDDAVEKSCAKEALGDDCD